MTPRAGVSPGSLRTVSSAQRAAIVPDSSRANLAVPPADAADLAQLYAEQARAAARRAAYPLSHEMITSADTPLAPHPRWPQARVIRVGWSEPDAAGRFRRVALVQPDDLPYLIRVEEMVPANPAVPYAPAPAAAARPKTPETSRGGEAPAAWVQAAAAPAPATPGAVLVAEELGDRILVQLAAGATYAELDALAGQIGATIERRVSAVGLYRLRLSQPAPDAAPATAVLLANLAAAHGKVHYSETDPVMRAALAPNDPKFADGTLWGLNAIQAPAAWNVRNDASTVIVAIIDTGLNFDHEDLRDNLWANPGESGTDTFGRDKSTNGVDDDGDGYVDDLRGINAITDSGSGLDDNKHGSHVAGTIAGRGNNGVGVAGVAWRAQLLTGKFLSASGNGATSDAIQCIDYAVARGADILSNSWGGAGFSQSLLNAIDRARVADVPFIAAAGNDAQNTDTTAHYPSGFNLSNVVSVAALTSGNALASFSNYGAQTVDLGAPGSGIYSCTNTATNSYTSLSGTSMACPHVAGAAALLRAQFPTLTHQEIIGRLLTTVTATASLNGKTVTGGRLNLAAALNVQPTGLLDVSVTAPDGLRTGQPGMVQVRVSDVSPVTGANVTAATQLPLGLNFTAVASVPGLYQAPVAVPADAANITLNVTVTAGGKTPFHGVFILPVVTPPANDLFADATVISGTDNTVTGSNAQAGKETGEPNHAGFAGGHSVWWKWTSPGAGSVSVNTTGSNFDTLLAVYAGSAVNALSLRAGNDDSGGNTTSALTFTASAGGTYYVAVDGYDGASGNITLRVSASWAAAPTVVTQPANRSVTAPAGTMFSITATGSPAYQWQRLPAGAATWANLANGGSYSNVTTATLTLGNTTAEMSGDKFRCVASNANGAMTSNTATLTVAPPPMPPANDLFASAIALNSTAFTVTGSNALATAEPGEPFHYSGGSGRASVWWAWTAPVSGLAAVNTTGSNFDTVLAVYTGAAVNALSLIGNNDDSGGGTTSAVSFNAVAGTTYRIAVDGFGTASSGNLTLSLQMLTLSPVFATQPADALATYGGNVTFTVSANATPAPAYQWQQRAAGGATWSNLVNGPGIAGVKTAALTLSGVTEALENTAYRCVATNSAGAANSNAAVLSVRPPAFAVWAGQLGLSEETATPASRPYGDGLSNLARYVMNLGPAPAPGELPALAEERDGDTVYLKLQFRRRKHLTGATLEVVSSGNLSTWTPVPSAQLVPLPDDDSETERWEARVPVPAGAPLFLRLQATLAQ